MFVGLVRDPGWQPPEGFPEPNRQPRSWGIPWRAVAWVTLFFGLLKLVPVVDEAFGPLAAYGLLIATVSVGVWRFDRWCGSLYWRGLRDYQS